MLQSSFTQALSLEQLLDAKILDEPMTDVLMPVQNQAQIDTANFLAEIASQIDELAKINNGEISAAQTQTDSESQIFNNLKGDGNKLAETALKLDQGMQDIAKQLLKMSDQLPTLKQCMADVSAGNYVPTTPAKLAAGGKTEGPKLDTTTDKPVQIIVTATPLISSDTEIKLPKKAEADAAESPAEDAVTPAPEESADQPAEKVILAQVTTGAQS